MAVVAEVLASLGVGATPRMVVFNKADLLPGDEREPALRRARATHPGSVVTSALSEGGLAELARELRERLDGLEEEIWLALPAADARGLARLYGRGAVLERRFRNGRVEVRFAGRAAEVARLRREGLVVGEEARE
jgi:GTP-binding protein HflX